MTKLVSMKQCEEPESTRPTKGLLIVFVERDNVREFGFKRAVALRCRMKVA